MRYHIKPNAVMDDLEIGSLVAYDSRIGKVVEIEKKEYAISAKIKVDGDIITLPQKSIYNTVGLYEPDVKVFAGDEQDLLNVPSSYAIFVKKIKASALKIGSLIVLDDKTITMVTNKRQAKLKDIKPMITIYVDHERKQFSCYHDDEVYVLALEKKNARLN